MFFVAPALFEELGAEAHDDAAVEQAIIDAVVEITGDARAARPSRVDLAVWGREPWLGGGPNTVMGPGVLSRLAGVMGVPEGPEGRVHFASAEQSLEWTGYVEGALAAAERATDALLSTLRERDDLKSARRESAPSPRRRPAYLQAALAGTALAALTPALRATRWWARRAAHASTGPRRPTARAQQRAEPDTPAR
jgi:hypothetical protein